MWWGVLDHLLREDLVENLIHFLVHRLLVAALLVGSLDVEVWLHGLRCRNDAFILFVAAHRMYSIRT